MNKCSLCGKDKETKRPTYYIALTKEGLVCTTKCASPDLTVIGSSKSRSEAEEIAATVRKYL